MTALAEVVLAVVRERPGRNVMSIAGAVGHSDTRSVARALAELAAGELVEARTDDGGRRKKWSKYGPTYWPVDGKGEP